jgi:hypothetical protein
VNSMCPYWETGLKTKGWLSCNHSLFSYKLWTLTHKTVPLKKMSAFWDISLCSFVQIDRSFRGDYCSHDGVSKDLWNVVRFLRH